jgi:hypothetical protein
MATELTTVFLPLINETRMAEYLPGDFQIHTRTGDVGLDIDFAPLELDDQSVFMLAPGEVFFIAAGTTATFTYGPEITAPIDKNVVLVHVVSTYEWAPILATTGQPVAEWWSFEGISTESFEQFLDAHDLESMAAPRGYANGDELRMAVLSGTAGLNELLLDEQPVSFGALITGADDRVSLGVRAWASFESALVELDAVSALATIKSLAPPLADHPLLVQVLSDISTSDVTIHVRFVFWETKRDPNTGAEVDATSETDKGQFVPVSPGSRISLQKRSPGPVYAAIVEETVVDNGQVALIAPRADLNAVNLTGGESLVFRVDVPAGTRFETQYQHARTPRQTHQQMIWGQFSDAWLTEGRSTTDETIGNLDFLVAYENTVVGSVEQPIEYYAGIPVFLQIQYPVVYVSGDGAAATFSIATRKAPKGIQVDIFDAAQTPMGSFRTDEHGQIWGMLALGYDTLQLPFEVIITYEMVDESIGLLPINGEVVNTETPFSSANTYSSNSDSRNSDAFFDPLKSSLGKPYGNSTATQLVTIQVGFAGVGGTAVSDFSSVDGRHAGIMHALQQLRYIHQWYYHLTEGFALNGVNESWSSILARHNQGQGTWATSSDPTDQNYLIALPMVRVAPPFSSKPEDLFGEADCYDLPTSGIKTRTWCLTLYGYGTFTMNSTLAGKPVVKDNKAQFWRIHTIWHEFTHAVVNMALERLFKMETHIGMTLAKDQSTSGSIYNVIFDSLDSNNNNFPLSGGWSALEEALGAVPEVALMETATGTQPQFDPPPPASPRHLIVNYLPNPGTYLKLDQGMNVDLNQKMGLPPLTDRRLGLRVPIAFTWAMWSALKNVGGFSQTLLNHVTGDQALNDLSDAVSYLQPAQLAKAKAIFQALFWGPIVALRTPDIPSIPPQWNDLTQPAFGPTTFGFMQAIQTKFWNRLNAAEKTAIKDLFGDADNPESFYLWFSFP